MLKKISNCELKFKDINVSLSLEKSKSGLYTLDLISLARRMILS